MADSIAITASSQEASSQVRLACRLRPKDVVGVRGSRKGMGELELENLSQEVVEIRYQMSPLQYLDLVVTGPSGAVISEGHFGDRFSPMAEEQTLLLQPAEKFTREVPLLGTVPREKRLAGVYRVQAVFEYNGTRAVSEPINVFAEQLDS